jgi:hypothetical protein
MDFLSQLQAFKVQLDQVMASQAASKAQADLMLAQYTQQYPLAEALAAQVQAAIDALSTVPVTPLR